MSAGWRKGVSQLGSMFMIGLIMCFLSMAINWAIVYVHALLGWFGLVPLSMLVGALMSINTGHKS